MRKLLPKAWRYCRIFVSFVCASSFDICGGGCFFGLGTFFVDCAFYTILRPAVVGYWVDSSSGCDGSAGSVTLDLVMVLFLTTIISSLCSVTVAEPSCFEGVLRYCKICDFFFLGLRAVYDIFVGVYRPDSKLNLDIRAVRCRFDVGRAVTRMPCFSRMERRLGSFEVLRVGLS